jgi:site-specific recombinase XerD
MKIFESFLEPLFDEYFIYRESLGYTTETTLNNLKVFDRYVKEKKIEKGLLNPSFFLELRADLKMESRSVNRVLSSVRVFFQFLVRKGIYEQNPLQDIPPLPENDIVPFVCTPEQTDQLLTAVCKRIRKAPWCYLKDLSQYMAMVLIARCGLRISEPLRLMRNHYRQEEKTLYIEKTKFKKDRLIPVPMAVATEVENYLAVRDTLLENYHIPYLLIGNLRGKLQQNSVSYTFRRAVKDIGLDQPRQVIGNKNFSAPTVHSLRHSFAINTLKAVKQRGNSPQNALPVLAAFMGHSEYKHTIHYLKVLDAEHRQALFYFVSSQKENI